MWKPGAHLAYISVLVYFWFSVGCCFAFFRNIIRLFTVLLQPSASVTYQVLYECLLVDPLQLSFPLGSNLKLRHVYQWLFGCIGPCFLCWQICERNMSGLDRGRLWSLYQRMFSHSCSKVLTVDGVYFNFKPVVWDLKKCWFYLNISADLSHKLLGKGGNSSFVKCPPLNWKVGCSIHSDWVNCRSVPWAWAFTSTALART